VSQARINLGNIEESLNLYDSALATYKQAITMDNDNVKGYNAICR
jgi:tetratricopeptide (TPR) repeat protein